jgi:mono/diheme cytochrome c family protein
LKRWLCFLFVSAAAFAAEKPAPPWEKRETAFFVGRRLFRENCAVCHDIDKDQKSTRKIGPSLHHLFKNPKLPLSKGKPNRAYVMVRIQYGGPVMPAFMKRMNGDQMAILMAYLESK